MCKYIGTYFNDRVPQRFFDHFVLTLNPRLTILFFEYLEKYLFSLSFKYIENLMLRNHLTSIFSKTSQWLFKIGQNHAFIGLV